MLQEGNAAKGAPAPTLREEIDLQLRIRGRDRHEDHPVAAPQGVRVTPGAVVAIPAPAEGIPRAARSRARNTDI